MTPYPNQDAFEDVCEALADMFAMMDEGLLVRDTTHDITGDWAIRAMDFVRRLKKADAALARARNEKETG